jgi:hypothetical protein
MKRLLMHTTNVVIQACTIVHDKTAPAAEYDHCARSKWVNALARVIKV